MENILNRGMEQTSQIVYQTALEIVGITPISSARRSISNSTVTFISLPSFVHTHAPRVNYATGHRSYQMVGGSPHVSPMQAPMRAQQYGMSPPQLGYTPPFRAQGVAATPILPPLALGPSHAEATVPTRRWEELYDSRGNKYWVNTVTRQSTNIDPYI
ncbi:unnamed protein product [Ectocarpus sp. 12 AP-2014]